MLPEQIEGVGRLHIGLLGQIGLEYAVAWQVGPHQIVFFLELLRGLLEAAVSHRLHQPQAQSRSVSTAQSLTVVTSQPSTLPVMSGATSWQ